MLKKVLFTSAVSLMAGAAMAASCSFDLKSTDQMTYNVKEITVPASCKEFTINLSHVGKLPKAAMGHNVVITKSADMKGVAADGVKAGAGKDYIKPADKRVIAASKMIGGGEKASVKFAVDKVKGGANFFCTFPAHLAKMQGKIVVK